MIEIFHVSDLHFGKPGVNPAKFLKALDKKFQISAGPNRYLLVTGDITQSGTRGQYDQALRALRPFKGRIIFVPGNHDYGQLTGFFCHDEKARDFDAYFASRLDPAQQYYQKTPYVRPIEESKDNKVLVIGLNSCLIMPAKHKKFVAGQTFGLVGYYQLSQLKEALTDNKYAHMPKIVALHHIPCKMAKGFSMDLLDWEDLMRVAREPVDIFAFGHEGAMGAPEDRGGRGRPEAFRPMSAHTERTGRSERTTFLDANRSVKNRACYHIKVENGRIRMPRKVHCAWS